MSTSPSPAESIASSADAETAAPLSAEGAVCPNCLTPVADRFCPHCGQKQGPLEVSVWHFLGEALDELFSLDAKLMRTLVPLLFRPGKLTADYFAGRRERYVRPFRLYLTCSVAMFLVLALTLPMRQKFQQRAVAEGYREAHPGLPMPADPAKKVDEKIARLVERAPEPYRDHLENFTKGGIYATTARLERINQTWGPRVNVVVPPFVALILLMLLGRRRPHYVDHFIFCLHLYSFTCLMGILMNLGPLVLRGPPIVYSLSVLAVESACFIYLVLALRRAYGLRWLATLGSGIALQLGMLLIGLLFSFAADAIVILRY